MYSIEIKTSSLDLLTLTNVGAYTQELSDDGKTIKLTTADEAVAFAWSMQLADAKRNAGGQDE